MPAYIPLSIATFSIIGEKQARSLEPVLAAPIRTSPVPKTTFSPSTLSTVRP